MDRETLHRQQRIRQLYEQEGWGCARIARELIISRQRVFQVKKELGLKKPGSAPLPEAERLVKLAELMRKGWTNRNIARSLNVAGEVVARDLAQHPEREALLQARKETRPAWRRRQQILGLIEQGLTGPQIAKRLHVSQTMIASDRKVLKLSPELKAKVRENARVATGRSVAAYNRARADRPVSPVSGS